MQIFLFFALFIAVLAAIFAVQNNAPTNVSFAIWDFQGSIALVLLVALAAGALISFFVSLPSSIKTRWTIRQQRRKMTEMEGNLTHLHEELELTQKKLELLQNPPIPEVPALPEVPYPTPQNPPSVEVSPVDTIEEKTTNG